MNARNLPEASQDGKIGETGAIVEDSSVTEPVSEMRLVSPEIGSEDTYGDPADHIIQFSPPSK